MIKRGEIYYVHPDPIRGHEQAGRRPMLVVSSDALNSSPLVVLAVPGTKATNLPADYSVNVRVSPAESGLPLETVFLCYQVRALDHSRFQDPANGQYLTAAGRLSPAKMQEIEAALRTVLEL